MTFIQIGNCEGCGWIYRFYKERIKHSSTWTLFAFYSIRSKTSSACFFRFQHWLHSHFVLCSKYRLNLVHSNGWLIRKVNNSTHSFAEILIDSQNYEIFVWNLTRSAYDWKYENSILHSWCINIREKIIIHYSVDLFAFFGFSFLSMSFRQNNSSVLQISFKTKLRIKI